MLYSPKQLSKLENNQREKVGIGSYGIIDVKNNGTSLAFVTSTTPQSHFIDVNNQSQIKVANLTTFFVSLTLGGFDIYLNGILIGNVTSGESSPKQFTSNITNNVKYGINNITYLPQISSTGNITGTNISYGFLPMVYVSPTPSNNITTNNRSIPINISITEPLLKEVLYNWNGTNYTIYNSSLLLNLNMNNATAIGDNRTFAVDVSVYANNFSCYSATCPIYNTSGKYGGAFTFVAGSSMNFSKTTLDLRSTNVVTISMWLYKDSFGTGDLMGFENTINANNYNTSFYFDTDSNIPCSGEMNLFINGNATDGRNGACYTRPSTGAWHHYVAILDKGKSSNETELYIDGTYRLPTSRWQNNDNTNNFGNNPLFIMSRGGGSLFNTGHVDNFMIWNRSLSADEINQLYMWSLDKYNMTQWYFYVNQSLNSSTGLNNGTYTYYANATDTYGISEQTADRQVNIPQDYPSVLLISPENNSNFNNTGITFFVANSTGNIGLVNTTLYLWNYSLFERTTLTTILPNSTSQIVYNGTLTEITNSATPPSAITTWLVSATCEDDMSATGDGRSCLNPGGSTALDALFLWNITIPNYNSIRNISLTSISAKIGSVTDNLTLAIFNYSSGAYVIINRSVNPTTDANTTLTYMITSGQVNNFVSSNQLALLSYTQGGANADLRQEFFEADIDYRENETNSVLIGTNTTLITGVTNTTNSSLAMANNGTYIWNYFTCDKFGQCVFGTNFTFNWTGVSSGGNVTDSCTYTSGNWNLLCSDNCNINSNVDLNHNNLTISGDGTLKLNANITNIWRRYWITSGTNYCNITKIGGGFSYG